MNFFQFIAQDKRSAFEQRVIAFEGLLSIAVEQAEPFDAMKMSELGEMAQAVFGVSPTNLTDPDVTYGDFKAQIKRFLEHRKAEREAQASKQIAAGAGEKALN
jgi:hypothetical protein